MSQANFAMEAYLPGLRNQHAGETQAICTVKNKLSRMEAYPELHAQVTKERAEQTEQAAHLNKLLEKHGTSASLDSPTPPRPTRC